MVTQIMAWTLKVELKNDYLDDDGNLCLWWWYDYGPNNYIENHDDGNVDYNGDDDDDYDDNDDVYGCPAGNLCRWN